jgi:hypothetical protein
LFSSTIGFVLPTKQRSYKGAVARLISGVFVCKPGDASRHHRSMTDAAGTISSRSLGRPQEELSALPIWAFTLGIFALLTFGLTAVPSIICGHLALARTRSSERGSLAKSVALAGLVIGYVSAALLGTWIVVLSRSLFQ